MFRFLTATFHRLIESLDARHFRYLYPFFNLRNRLTGLIGPRGVGKTTLLLQYIKNELYAEGKTFYFSADSIYFQQTTLLGFINDLHINEGYNTIFIDEIHKYQGWNQELKNIYDSFPELKIVFSGSSMLNLVEGSYDLSRRAKLYRLNGLSFREFLNFHLNINLEPLSFPDIINNTDSSLVKLREVEKILSYFDQYLKNGYYPFVFENPDAYYEKVARVIEKTIFEDIASFFNLKTSNLQYFKKLLTYLASIPPGELNFHNLAKHLGIDQKTVEHYSSILATVGMIREMRSFEGGSVGARKPVKILLDNTNIIHTMQQYLGHEVSKGMERELFFVQSMQNAAQELFYSKQADYRTRDIIFEVGGKNKTKSQLKEIKGPCYLVKDGILQPLKGEIPLFLFGFLY
ncbi:MAG: AAA family ATPase [Candidatus Protochlamydia sp.]|nr:AAA family ATPase [Candidatus Protochlamydia sp.]